MSENTGARLSYIPIFSEMVRDIHRKLIEFEAQENIVKKKTGDARLTASETEFELQNLQSEIDKCAIMVIVFCAMALEAYIYDYASRKLTDSYVQDHLDKLDTLSKWVVIPKLVTGKELPKDHRWFSLLKRLIQQRNTLAHHKSSSLPPKFENAIVHLRKIDQKGKDLEKTAHEAVELLDLLLDEIKWLDAEEFFWAHAYLAAKSDKPYT